MAQLKINSSNEMSDAEPIYGGLCHRINFGKHKGKTFFDLANEKDWDYLKWANKAADKKEGLFRVSKSCIPYIRAALRSKEAGGTWNYKYIEGGLIFETDTGLKSPVVPYSVCPLCQKNKMEASLQSLPNGLKTCWACSKKVTVPLTQEPATQSPTEIDLAGYMAYLESRNNPIT